jgi:MFS family permease
MTTPSGTDPSLISGTSGVHGPTLDRSTHWRDALAGLLASRLALIQWESQAARREIVKCIAGLVMAAVAAVFSWALVLAGAIAALAAATGWSWFWLALAAALLHALFALGILLWVNSSRTPVFPITRNEFQKDRQWLQTLKSPQK